MAELVGRGAASDEFLDRWRVPGESDSHVWEERFGEEMYVPLAREAFADALKDAGITESDIDHAVVVGLHVRAVKAVRAALGIPEGVMAPDLTGRSAISARPTPASALADVLERAEPGQVIVVLSLADGADALVLRTTDALPAAQAAARQAGVPTVAEQLAAGRTDLSYAVVPDRGGDSSTASRHAGPIPNVPVRRSCTAPRPGSTPSRPAVAWTAASAISRRPGSASSCHSIDRMTARTPGRHPGHHRHLHHRPSGLQPVPAGGGRHRRLRRRRSLPLRDDRRRRSMS